MRLFYAVNFSREVKRRLLDIQGALRAQSLRGNFTLPDNLHLTLAFIGEVAPDRSGPLRELAEAFHFTPFDILFNGVGRFRREGGDILWAGIEESKDLAAVYHKLSQEITDAGFDLDRRKFTPHLTLAREARLKDGFALADYSRSLTPFAATVNKVSLMKSERINGRLSYTEIG